MKIAAWNSKRMLGLLVLLLLGYGLGSFGLLEDNEARFFEIAWEMQRSGDWLTPRLNFLTHFHKPPGTFWLVGGSMRLFGESEWAGRLPVALAALFTLGMVWRWSRNEGDQSEANRAVLVLVTSVEFWFLSRLVLTDMFLTVTVTAAFWAAWTARSSPSSKAWSIFWLALGLSFLIKGPIGLVIVAPVLGLYSLTVKDGLRWNLRPALGVPLLLLVSLPWYLVVCAQHQGLLDYFLGFQTAQRFLTTVHGRPGPWWFYLPVLLAGFFPWSVGFVPTALRRVFKDGDGFDRLLLLWVAFPVFFFSLSGSKLPTYLLPIFPALAILTARCGRRPKALRLAGTIALVSLGVFAFAVLAFLQQGSAKELLPATPYLFALAALIGVVVLTTLLSDLDDASRFSVAGWTFAGSLLLLASALGPCDRAFSARALAAEIQNRGSREVAEVADHLHGLPYYLQRRIVQVSYPRETFFDHPSDYSQFLFPDLQAYFASRTPGDRPLIVIRRSDYESYANPAWPTYSAGPWMLLEPASPNPSP